MKRTVLLSLALLASACPNNTGPAGDGPWAATTHPFDPTCASCTEAGSGKMAHVGGVRWLADSQTDDPPAQWGRCMMSFLRCADGGGEYPACVEKALCPDVCKAEYARVLAGSTDFAAEAAAVEAVFINDGAPCAAPEENPTVTP